MNHAGQTGDRLRSEGTIRTTGTILLILVLAAAAVIGSYSLLLAARRGPVPTAPPAPQVDLPPEIPDPGRLPRLTPAQPASIEIGDDEAVLTTVAVIVAGARRDDRAGVAILDGNNGAPLAWRPLATGEETPEGLRLTFAQIPSGRHVVALAASSDRARYSYRTRAALEITPGDDAPPVLDARTQDVVVRPELQGRPPDSLPPIFRLVRTDDPTWHPGMHVASVQDDPMTVPKADGTLRLLGLGPGRYALKPLDGDYTPFEFTVPGPASLTARFAR